MKRNSLIKGILLVTIMAVLMIISGNAYAADDNTRSSAESNNSATNNAATNNSATNNAATNNSALTSTLTPTTSNNNTATALDSNLPKTGIADNTIVFVVIGVCAVAAIYAYKKVRDYKGI